jgi:hypothetical protein
MRSKGDKGLDWKQQMGNGLGHWIQLCIDDEKHLQIKEQLLALREDIEDELTVMIAGEFNAGKSTFINALLGQKILSSDVTPETAMVTKLTYGTKRTIIAHYLNGQSQVYDDAWLEQLTAERDGTFKHIRRQLSHVELQLPLDILKTLTIIDTPGLNANNEYHTQATERFLGRTDHAIFLFHAMNVGTATEIKWLKKFNEKGIYPFGIINRIDELDEEEDDLEGLIDFNLPRLGPAIQKLFGVSARDALFGKLGKNDQLLEWSNWAEVENLLEKFREETNRKIERAYSRLIEPIREMDKLSIDRKLSLPLRKLDSTNVERFVSKEFPDLLSTKEKLKNHRVMAKSTVDHWKSILGTPIYTMDGFSQFLIRFMEIYKNMGSQRVSQLKNDPIQVWEGLVSDHDHSFDKKRTVYNRKFNDLKNDREELEKSWNSIRYSNSLFKRSKIEKHRRKVDFFHSDRERLGESRRELIGLFTKMTATFNHLKEGLKTFVERDIKFYHEKEHNEVERWNRQLDKLNHSFANFQSSELEEIELFFNWLNEFQEKVAVPLYAAGNRTENLLPYEESIYLLGNLVNLKQGLPPADFYANWRMMKSFSKEERSESSFSFPTLTPPELLHHQLEGIPAELKHNTDAELKAIHTNHMQWLKIAAALVALTLFIAGVVDATKNDEDYSDSVDTEEFSDYYDDSDDADDEQQRLDEEKQELAAQYPIAYIESFLESVHPQLNSDHYIHNELFGDYAWTLFQPYFEGIDEGELVSLEVTNIDYLSGENIRAVVKEIYDKEGIQQEFENEYTLSTDTYYGEALIIEDFSFQLLKEIEKEISLEDNEIADFLGEFRNDYMRSLNDGNASHIDRFFEEQSTARDQLNAYIDSIAGKGFFFEEQGFQIDTVSKVEINEYKISTTENFMRTDDQNEVTRNVRKKDYLVKVFPEIGPLIMEITTVDSQEEIVIIPTTHLVSAQHVNDFIRRYYYAFESAFNGNGFSYVQAFYDPNGKGYEDQEAYIVNANNKNMQMTNLELNVDNIVVADDNHYLVTVTNIDEYFYQDGTGDRKKVRATYKVLVTTDGDMLISENPTVEILENIEL